MERKQRERDGKEVDTETRASPAILWHSPPPVQTIEKASTAWTMEAENDQKNCVTTSACVLERRQRRGVLRRGQSQRGNAALRAVERERTTPAVESRDAGAGEPVMMTAPARGDFNEEDRSTAAIKCHKSIREQINRGKGTCGISTGV